MNNVDMSNLKKIPITKEIVHVIMTAQPPEYLFPILLKYFNSNVSSEVFDDFLARIIILCAIYNNAKVLEYMIRWGGDPETPLSAISQRGDNRTALNIARERGSSNIVEYLLSKPAQKIDRKRYLEDLPLPIDVGDIKLLPGRRPYDPDFLNQEFMNKKNAAQEKYYNGLGGKRRRSRRSSSRRKSTRRRSGRR